MSPHELPDVPFTRSQLQRAFGAIGIAPGQTLMLHASVKAVGCVMGGPNAILSALLDALTPTGTLMMYAGWQDIPDFVQELPPEIRKIYSDEHPAFDPAVSRAVRQHGILAEFLRTWPGTQRSLNPEASMIANGLKAAWLTRDHPMNYGYGDGSPLAKLVELKGKVLMLGAPLDSMTLLHYAEFRARLRRKNVVHYQCPILDCGKKIWADVEDFDTGKEHDSYTFEEIAQAYSRERVTGRAKIGNVDSCLFDAADLSSFAVVWLEGHFG
jgi:aminoglycoside 3-N-acetyltransferase